MDRRMWCLVEWVEEKNIFPSYGIVSSDSLHSGPNDIHPGKIVFARTRYADSCRAQILRISGDKRQIKEYKIFLERQDHQVKNVIAMCMRTIKEMRTDPTTEFGIPTKTSHEAVAGPSSAGCDKDRKRSSVSQVAADTDSDSSDVSDSEASSDIEDAIPLRVKSAAKHQTAKFKRFKPSPSPSPNVHNQSINQPLQRRPMVSSTPLPIMENVKVTYDQQTQTEKTGGQWQSEKIKEMEKVLTKLYSQYLVLEGRVQNIRNRNLERPSNVSDAEGTNSTVGEHENGMIKWKNNSVQRAKNNGDAEMKLNELGTANAKTLHVRRVSAQTTNNAETIYEGNANDMVPIGQGSVSVPARLIREINWDSYSTATRQLLQAVFPRKMLATHSLSGKSSPAFAHKPPKKQLDPKAIEDIVDAVSQRCGVAKRLVRSSITTKCTDEAKLYRNRQHCRSRRVSPPLENADNVPPSASSHESSNEMESPQPGQIN